MVLVSLEAELLQKQKSVGVKNERFSSLLQSTIKHLRGESEVKEGSRQFWSVRQQAETRLVFLAEFPTSKKQLLY